MLNTLVINFVHDIQRVEHMKSFIAGSPFDLKASNVTESAILVLLPNHHLGVQVNASSLHEIKFYLLFLEVGCLYPAQIPAAFN